jgi:hypothetical protein
LSPVGRRLIEDANLLGPLATLRLLFGRLETRYWDTHYTMLDAFLNTASRLGQEALAPVRTCDGWQQEYDLHLRAFRTYSLKLKVRAEDHGGMKRLFRAQLSLHQRWRFMGFTLGATLLRALSALVLPEPVWLLSGLAGALAFATLVIQVSKFGGQLVTLLEAVAEEHKLYSLAHQKTSPAREEAAPVLEEN